MGPFGATCLPAPRSSTVLAAQDDSRKIRAVKRPKLGPSVACFSFLTLGEQGDSSFTVVALAEARVDVFWQNMLFF